MTNMLRTTSLKTGTVKGLCSDFLLKDTLIEKRTVVLLAASCSQDVGPSD